MELLLIPIQQWGDPLTLICDPSEAYDTKAEMTYKGLGFFLVFKESATPVGRCSCDLTEHHFCLAAICARVCSSIVSVMKNIPHSKPSEEDPGVF